MQKVNEIPRLVRNEIFTSNRHQTVALNCVSIANALFHALTRLYRVQHMKETERETEKGVPADPEVKQMLE